MNQVGNQANRSSFSVSARYCYRGNAAVVTAWEHHVDDVLANGAAFAVRRL